MKKKPKYAPSIMQDERECFLQCEECLGRLDQHEIFFGRNRLTSIENGCWVWVCRKHHMDIHNDDTLNKKLKRECQKVYEDLYGHDEYMKKFSKGYL